MKKILIAFRTTSAIASFHGTPRPFNLSKDELTIKCFNSLQSNLELLQDYSNYTIDIIAISDRSSSVIINHLKQSSFVKEIIECEPGNSGSAKKSLEVVDNLKDEYDTYAFLEDDYYYYYSSLFRLDAVFKSEYINEPLFIIPCADFCHFGASVPGATNLFLCRGSFFSFFFNRQALEKHHPELEEIVNNWHVDDSILWHKVYKHHFEQEGRSLAISFKGNLSWHAHSGQDSIYSEKELKEMLGVE